ncbi:hypothetical protein D3OALGA1CA_3141 [Olavius algarvensis associated proteobacterium Delta 3]|nr:hypothetical protein D3OALGA1CA_3141 [Olavius algarvensis associated proteobacterium Delta 3]CAB5159259.1 hypothetical protein D3OALGB2SA_5323 [Olavius algarvensis associated proteobacterium Delta 3]
MRTHGQTGQPANGLTLRQAQDKQDIEGDMQNDRLGKYMDSDRIRIAPSVGALFGFRGAPPRAEDLQSTRIFPKTG